MITMETISELITKLEEANSHFDKGTTPDKQWMSDVSWLVYLANRDIMNNELKIDGFLSEDDAKLKDDEIEDLNDQIADQDEEINNLLDRIEELKEKLENLESGEE